MAIKKVIATNGYDNGGACINPNSLKIPPTTTQRIAGDTITDLSLASGVIHDRFNNPRYYTGDTTA